MPRLPKRPLPQDAKLPVEQRAESAQARGLRSRLARDELTPEDKRRYGHTQAIMDGRLQGKTFQVIAEELGEARSSLGAFARTGIFKVISEHILALEVCEDEKVAEETVKRVRVSLDSMSPHVRDFVRWAAQKRPDGEWRDAGAAQWAAQFLAKATAVDTPVRAVRPSIHVHIDTIQNVVGDIRCDAAAAARASGVSIDAVATVVEDALEMGNGA